MQVRLKIGRRAGEVADVAPEAARAMLADGRATDYRDEVNARLCGPELSGTALMDTLRPHARALRTKKVPR